MVPDLEISQYQLLLTCAGHGWVVPSPSAVYEDLVDVDGQAFGREVVACS
jgi:hypothetical protein